MLPWAALNFLVCLGLTVSGTDFSNPDHSKTTKFNIFCIYVILKYLWSMLVMSLWWLSLSMYIVYCNCIVYMITVFLKCIFHQGSWTHISIWIFWLSRSFEIWRWEVWSGGPVVVQEVEPHTFTEVSLPVGSWSEGNVLGLEVSLNTDTTINTTINTTVYFNTVFRGELHSWSLHTARERKVTKYLCGVSQTQPQVKYTKKRL